MLTSETILKSSTLDCLVPDEGTVHDCSFRLSDEKDSYRVLIINDFLSNKDLNEYLSKSCTVTRYRMLTALGYRPRYETCYSTDGGIVKRGPIQYVTAKYPEHVLSLVQKIQTVVEQNYENNVTLSTGIDIHYSSDIPGSGRIERHSDNAEEWCAVAVYSLGQTRYLRVRENQLNSAYYNVKLRHNSLVIMLDSIDSEPGQFQRLYTHQIDKLQEGEVLRDRLLLNVRFLSRLEYCIKSITIMYIVTEV